MLQIKPPTWAEVLLLAVEIPGIVITFFFLPSYPGYKDLGETALLLGLEESAKIILTEEQSKILGWF